VPESVCVIRISAIGDCCHTLPVVRSLQAAWPRTRFTWIIGRVEASLFGDIPDIEFIVFDKSRGLRAFRDFHRRMHGRRYPLLLHMHASMRANVVSRLIRADVRLGFDRARARDYQWLVTNSRIASRPKQHVMDGLFGFANALQVERREVRWDIPIAIQDRDFADSQLGSGRPVVVVSPCTSQRFRNYRASRYEARVILTGGDSALERSFGHTIAQHARRSRPVNLVGRTTLKQLLAILDRASVLVCPDSGPVHMATAVGTPVVGLYATSNRFRTGPYFSQDLVVDKYPEAVRREFNKSVDEIPWGGRVRSPDALDLIRVEDVKDKLDRALG
jgi:heptosyltransferase I